MNTKNDQYWLDALRSGDEKERNRVVEEIFREYDNALLGYVKSIYWTFELYKYTPAISPEDILQDIWMYVLEHLESADIRISLKDYLRKIAHNWCYDLAKRKRRERTLEEGMPYDAELDKSIIRANDQMDARTVLANLDVPSLAPCQRMFLILRHGFGYKPQVIEQLTGIAAKNIYKSVHDALKDIREHVKDNNREVLPQVSPISQQDPYTYALEMMSSANRPSILNGIEFDERLGILSIGFDIILPIGNPFIIGEPHYLIHASQVGAPFPLSWVWNIVVDGKNVYLTNERPIFIRPFPDIGYTMTSAPPEWPDFERLLLDIPLTRNPAVLEHSGDWMLEVTANIHSEEIELPFLIYHRGF